MARRNIVKAARRTRVASLAPERNSFQITPLVLGAKWWNALSSTRWQRGYAAGFCTVYYADKKLNSCVPRLRGDDHRLEDKAIHLGLDLPCV